MSDSKVNESASKTSDKSEYFTPSSGHIDGKLKISQSRKSLKPMSDSEELVSESELVLSTTIDTSTSLHLTSGSSTTLSCLKNDDYSLGSSESSQNDYLKMSPDTDSETLSSLSLSSCASSEVVREKPKGSSLKSSPVKMKKVSLKDLKKRSVGEVSEQPKSVSYLQTTLTSSGSKNVSANQKNNKSHASSSRNDSTSRTSKVQERVEEPRSMAAQSSKSIIGQKKLNDNTNKQNTNVKPSISRVAAAISQSAPENLPCAAKSYFDRLNMLKKDLQSKSNGDFLLDFPETSISVSKVPVSNMPVPKAGRNNKDNDDAEIVYETDETIGFMRTPMTAPIPKCTKPIIPILKKKSQFDRIKTVNSATNSSKSNRREVSGDQSEVKGIKSSISFGDRSTESKNQCYRSHYNPTRITSSNIYTMDELSNFNGSKSQMQTEGNYQKPSISKTAQAQKPAPTNNSALMDNINSQARQIEYLQNKLDVAYKAIAERDRFIDLSNKKFIETESKIKVLVGNLEENMNKRAEQEAKAVQALKEKEAMEEKVSKISYCDIDIQVGSPTKFLRNSTTQSFKCTKTSRGVQTFNKKVRAPVRNTATNTYPLTAFSSTSESSQISEVGQLQLIQNKIMKNGVSDAKAFAQSILDKFTKDLLAPTGKSFEKSTLLVAQNENVEKVKRMMKTSCVGAANIALVCTASFLVVKSIKNVLSMVE